ncbi:MAG: RecQ family ATP-dependent DNA helicase [Bacteroidaceae bacterium]|nr:RecQ family ATP-dependent DNA helicase [Bacteroidaceae bacterium]
MNNEYLDILRQYWGYDSFRGIQEEIITSIGEGHDTLGLMPTGGGTSICFQVPALAKDGLCLVVTPLIALMKDQVSQLRKRGIKAAAVYSGMMRDDIVRTLDNCILGGYKFLYLSPERLSTDLFKEKLIRMHHVSLITVDEAHCVSQWGYDFRPSYLEIAKIRHIIPYHVPVLALTATATPDVVEDIQNRLEFSEHHAFSMSFERKNLIYVVRKTDDKAGEILRILKGVPQGSAIVYTRSRRLTSEIARYLNDNGISADSYHAGLTSAEKDLRQTNWTKNRNRVMVATNAFGMGIDKPDVRVVIHYNIPDSMESYFQEAGRAGRDGEASYAILLVADGEKMLLHRRVSETYPDVDYIKQTYENVCCFLEIGVGEAEGRTFDFSLEKFCRLFKQFAVHTDSSLKLLTNAGYIDYHEQQDFKSLIHILVRKEQLYTLHDNGKDQDLLTQAILRTYTGVFADFVPIEEMLLSHITGLSHDRVYNILKEMSRNRIIEYIPHRSTPTITFVQPRIDTQYIHLYDYVYADRKEDYKKRIDKMVDYAFSNTSCRSRMLLNYFGDMNAEDCGQCDVCLARKRREKENPDLEKARQAILMLLSDGKDHLVTELSALDVPSESLRDALREMVDEEEITIDMDKIRKQ